jgi:hypothetical protein
MMFQGERSELEGQEKYERNITEEEEEEIKAELQIELRWEQLGKKEVIMYEDEMFDGGGYEFSWHEPEDEDELF